MPRSRPASLKVRALQWLAQREHSPNELRAKLLRIAGRDAEPPSAAPHAASDAASHAAPPVDAQPPVDAAAEVDALLDWLTARGYLDAHRFVEGRVHARGQRFGNLRIQQELKAHGLTLDAEAALALKTSEFERALEVWRKKFGSASVDAAGRARQARFLSGRGFSADVVRRVVRHSDDD